MINKMKIIKFRGQHIQTKQWMFGSLILNSNNTAWIKNDDLFEQINPETIGQFIKNDVLNNELYVGDIVTLVNNNGNDWIIDLIYDDVNCKFCINNNWKDGFDECDSSTMKLIGNIYDNADC